MRERISEVRLREGQEPTERWAAGLPTPKPDGHLEVAKAVDAEGRVVGFNVYLLWGEPRVLGGKMREEPA